MTADVRHRGSRFVLCCLHSKQADTNAFLRDGGEQLSLLPPIIITIVKIETLSS